MHGQQNIKTTMSIKVF